MYKVMHQEDIAAVMIAAEGHSSTTLWVGGESCLGYQTFPAILDTYTVAHKFNEQDCTDPKLDTPTKLSK